MNKQLIEQWIAALKSGKYEQGKHYLKNENKFCCLGVACDIHPNNDWAFQSREYPNDNIQRDYGIDSLHCLSKIVYSLVVPAMGWNNLTYYFAFMNDTLEWSFPQIAVWIETHLLPLADDETIPNEHYEINS